MPQGQSHMAAIITKVLIILYGRNVLAQDIETFAIYFSLFCFFGEILFFPFFFFFFSFHVFMESGQWGPPLLCFHFQIPVPIATSKCQLR